VIQRHRGFIAAVPIFHYLKLLQIWREPKNLESRKAVLPTLPRINKINRLRGNPIMNPIQVPNDGGKSVNILGIPMLIRIHGRDTGGTVSVVESHDVTGGGPPPHIHHREDETFQILEGEYEWTVGGKTFIAKKGATIFAPRGVPHTYRYLGATPGRLMCVINPSGFEGFFEEIGALSPQQQSDIPRVMGIAQKYGLEILPPPGA
jgi:quercetin dioxygenase-like cupin family protein